MRILFLLQRYPGFGGIETVTKILAERFMDDYGHEVSIFSTSCQDVKTQLHANSLFAFKCCQEKGDRLNKEFRDFVESREPQIVIYQDSYIDDSDLLELLPEYVKIIVCEHNTPDALLIGLKSVTKDLPLNSFGNLWRKIRLPFRMNKLYKECKFHHGKMYDAADRYVLLSKSYKSILKRLYNIEGDKLLSIANPSTLSQQTSLYQDFLEKKPIALFVARLTAQKGIKYLLEIWEKVERRSDWKLVIVGDGDMMEWLREEIKKRKLQGVRLKGFQKDTVPYFREASIHLMTSIYEGFAMTNIEAMTYGTIPFSFDSFASVGDIISDERDGYIIKSFNTDDYADKVLRFIHMPEGQKSEMRKNAVNKSASFSADNIASEWNNLFTELL